MAYFYISSGLRGCYMPDNVYVVRANTRRELKETLANECAMLDCEDKVGHSKRDIATIAARAWRDRKAYGKLPYCLPYKLRGQNHYPYGVFVSAATRADYLEHNEGE